MPQNATYPHTLGWYTVEETPKHGRGPKYLKLEGSFGRVVRKALTKNDPPRNKKRPAKKPGR